MKPSIQNNALEENIILIYLFLDQNWTDFDNFARKVVQKEALTLQANPLDAVADPKIPGTFFQSGRTIASDKRKGTLVAALHTGQVLALLIISKELSSSQYAYPQNLYFRDTILLREWGSLTEVSDISRFWYLGWANLSECSDGPYGWILDAKHNDPVVLSNIIEQWWLLEFIILQAAISNLRKDIESIIPIKLLAKNDDVLLKYKYDVLKTHVQLFDQFINRQPLFSRSSLPGVLIDRAHASLKNCQDNLSSAGINFIPKTTRIFLSSTRGGLDKARELVRDALLTYGFYPDMMEYFPSEDTQSTSACLEHVAHCDGFILLLGGRYGWRPPGKGTCSITQLEWLEAGRLKIRRSVVLFEGDALPKEAVEDDEIGKHELIEWKKQLKENLVIVVSKPDDQNWLMRLMTSVQDIYR